MTRTSAAAPPPAPAVGLPADSFVPSMTFTLTARVTRVMSSGLLGSQYEIAAYSVLPAGARFRRSADVRAAVVRR
jgi:hypothetical protein